MMIDRMIETCAAWDWVSPLLAMWRSWRAGPSVTLFVLPGYLSAWEIERFLQGRGVDVWGVLVLAGGVVHLCVRAEQERLTVHLLSGVLGLALADSIDTETHTAPTWAEGV